MKIYSSRQQKSPIYREDTGRGLVTRPELWKKNQRIGNRIFIESTSDIRSDLDIHSELDLKIAELVLERIGDYDFLA
jgi:CMP-N-acetylneuraminic acid synthetase